MFIVARSIMGNPTTWPKYFHCACSMPKPYSLHHLIPTTL